MIIVPEEKSVTGLAGTTGVIVYSLMGTKFTNYGEKPFTLAQGTLTDAAVVLYTPEITETAKIQTIILTNTSALAVTGVKVLVDGTQISPALVIPANGCAMFDEGTGWKIYNTSGEIASIAGSALIGYSGANANTEDGDTIAHGFASAPTAVLVSGSVEAEMVSVTAIGATTFTVAIKTALQAAGTAQTVYWMALP
jgi:hypothetical protein